MKSGMWPLVSVVILCYNEKNWVKRCLGTVLSTDYPNFEIVFVDNASKDNSVNLVRTEFSDVPNIKIVINDRNYGYAKGNNIGFQHAKGKYVCFLNSDTEVCGNWLTEIVRKMEADRTVGAAQCKLLRLGNKNIIDGCGHVLLRSGAVVLKGCDKRDFGQYESPCDILSAHGAAFIIVSDLFRKIGGFDEDYFIYAEEVDLCLRIWMMGYKVVYVPSAIVLHKGGGGGSQELRAMKAFLYTRNHMVTLLKNFEFLNTIKLMTLYASVVLGKQIFELFKSKRMQNFLSVVKAFAWVVFNFKMISVKRSAIQKFLRNTKDSDFLPRVTARAFLVSQFEQ